MTRANLNPDVAVAELPTDTSAGHSPLGFGIDLRRSETWLNVFWVVLGLAICAYSFRLRIYGTNGPATGFFPMLAGAVVLATGLGLLLAQKSRVEGGLHFWPEQGSARRVWLVLGGLALLIVLMRYAGFIIAALVMMPLLLRAIEGRSWPFVLCVGAVSAAIVYLVFSTLLGTVLPRSPFGF